MDPERQPLLSPVRHDGGHCSRFRPLTHEEVLRARQDVSWTRIRFCIVLIFWGIMAMCLSIIACLLVRAPKCSSYDTAFGSALAVPPVHMSLAPLIYSGRSWTEDPSYTL